jgi:hypothetical protein
MKGIEGAHRFILLAVSETGGEIHLPFLYNSRRKAQLL